MTVLRWLPVLVLPAVLVLSGCSVAGQSSAEPPASAAANSAVIAHAYADCLTGEGIEGVTVGDDGYVGVSIDVSGPGGATGGGATGGGATGDDRSFNLDSGPSSEYSAAQTHCTAEVPGYHQPEMLDDPAFAAGLLSQSRAFSACARQNGITDFADPDAASGNRLLVPEGTTKAAFLAVVTACASAFGAVADGGDSSGTGGAAGNAGGKGTGTSGGLTIAMPQFGGAYDQAWTSEVTNILFAQLQSTPVAGQ